MRQLRVRLIEEITYERVYSEQDLMDLLGVPQEGWPLTTGSVRALVERSDEAYADINDFGETTGMKWQVRELRDEKES